VPHQFLRVQPILARIKHEATQSNVRRYSTDDLSSINAGAELARIYFGGWIRDHRGRVSRPGTVTSDAKRVQLTVAVALTGRPSYTEDTRQKETGARDRSARRFRGCSRDGSGACDATCARVIKGPWLGITRHQRGHFCQRFKRTSVCLLAFWIQTNGA